MERAPMTVGFRESVASLARAREVTDICLNGVDGIWFDRGAGMERQEIQSGPPHAVRNANGVSGEQEYENELRNWVLEEISRAGKTWDAKHPFVDATLELEGSGFRLHVAFPPISRKGILVSLRRLPDRGGSSMPGLECRWRSSPLVPLLRAAVERGESVLISGATGSGKTTLAGDLLEAVPATERLIILEDTPELAPRHPHAISLLGRMPNADGFGEVTLRVLLRQALRMRPDRIILGECRGPEVLDLLQALNSGHRGAMATLHANSARDAVRRLELLCTLATGAGLPQTAIRELLCVGVQWIAQVVRRGGERKVDELWRVEGREGDAILMRSIQAPP